MSPADRWSSTRTSRRRSTRARSAARRSTCSSSEPVTEHPLFGYPNVIVTPHLGASTTEATDRAGYQAAEQVIAALTGGVVTSAVNVPAIPSEDMDVLGPFVSLCRKLGRIAVELAEGSSIDRVETEFMGRIAERDTRLLAIQVLLGVLRGHTEEEVNEVNAPTMAEERGIELVETKRSTVRDYADLVRVDGDQRRGPGPGRGHVDRPAQPSAPARGVGPALRRPARGPRDDLPLPRPARDARPRRAPSSASTASTSSRPRSGASPRTRAPATTASPR